MSIARAGITGPDSQVTSYAPVALLTMALVADGGELARAEQARLQLTHCERAEHSWERIK